MPDFLDAVLGNLLAGSPDTGRLHYILEHINYWIVSRVLEERARVIRSSMALLRSTVTFAEFDNSAEFPRMGHHVAELALSLSDPAKDISWQAREGVSWLYQLLLHQRGLIIHEAEDLWVWDWHQGSRLLGYRKTATVREVFGKHFSVRQRRFFVRMAVLAIHALLWRVSQAGLVLIYSFLGEAQQLMGDKQEGVMANVMRQLRIIQPSCLVPEALQGLCL
ncbi:uncharacterized protein LOC116823544 [Chelonoidis abingdonii]|uniref:uncharacterized protein LOC116823544 n=1 Tax=Chelonoidis abingdonii TaxID=106734 RepID=UPI003F493B7D